MLLGLSRVMVWVLAAWAVMRVADLVFRGKLGAMFAFDLYSVMFLLETALVIFAVVLVARLGPGADLGAMVRAALVILVVGTLYRFDTYLVAFMPGEQWSYFPAVPELLITLGVVAAEVMIYIYIVKRFPILAGHAPGTRGSV
jgi:Ni/Fe-hydrogenase subunit HybB-like protein